MQKIYHCYWHEVVCSTFEATHIPCVTINTWEWMRRNKNVLHSTGAAHTYPDIPYSRKLLREKTFTNFHKFWGFLGSMASIDSTSEQSTNVFSAKIVFSTNSQRFPTLKVLCSRARILLHKVLVHYCLMLILFLIYFTPQFCLVKPHLWVWFRLDKLWSS